MAELQLHVGSPFADPRSDELLAELRFWLSDIRDRRRLVVRMMNELRGTLARLDQEETEQQNDGKEEPEYVYGE